MIGNLFGLLPVCFRRLLSSTSLRPLFLLSVSLLGVTLLERWKDKLPKITGMLLSLSVCVTYNMNIGLHDQPANYM